MNKILKKISSCVLSAIFTFSQNAVLAETPINLTKNSSQEKINILGEVPEKRSEFVKHFRLTDNSMKAIVYSDQVHYKDKNGEFKEINNTLIEGENDTYRNAESSFKVNFSKNFKNKNLVNIESENHSISISYIKKKYKKFVNVSVSEENQNESISSVRDNESLNQDLKQSSENKGSEAGNKLVSQAVCEEDLSKIPETEPDLSNAEIKNIDKAKIHFDNENEEKIYFEKTYSKAKYQNSDVNIDLDYTLSGLGLKENIVLKNKSNDNDRFYFELKTDLIAIKDENGNINFKDSSEKTVFAMPKGCMWDSNNAFSGDVNYEISKITGGYIISVIPNKNWLDDSSRVYPITVDPSITSNINTGITNTQISSCSPNETFLDSSHMSVGTVNVSDQWVGYIKSNNFPIFSHGEIITDAKLNLHPYPGTNDFGSPYNAYVTSADNIIGVKKLTSSWNQNITWNTKPQSENFIQDYFTTSNSTLNSYNTWNITRIVKEWYTLDDPNSNDGIEISTTNTNLYSVLRYVSAYDTININQKPYFEVSYKEFVGEESYWSYESYLAGYKGVGKVNRYAGTLSVSEDILSYTGSLNPVSISNTYNNINYNEQANAYFHTKKIPGGYSKSSFSGLGFRFSFDKIVYPLPSTDYMYFQGWRYIYIDGDGTQHYFKLENNTVVDEDGLGLTLTEIAENNESKIEIKDLKDNKLTFYKPESTDEIYVLKSQSDNNGNTTTCNYTNGKITSITDVANRTTTISYLDNTNKVSKITAADGKEVNFLYDGDRLKEVLYPENMKTIYKYDHQGRLCLVSTNEGLGRSVKYEYTSNNKDSSNFFKIRSFTEFGSQNANEKTKGSSTEFWYDINQTKITSKINNLDVPYRENTEIWQFDNRGRVTDVIDENGNFHETEYFKSSEETSRTKNRIKETATGQKIVHNLLKNSRADTADTSNWEIENWNPDYQSSRNCYGIIASTDEKNLGNYSFRVYNSQNDSSWPVARQIVSVPVSSEDQKYTFSADVKTDGELNGGEGAVIHVDAFKDNVQTSDDNYSRWLKSTDGEWKRISVTLNVPAGSNYIRCYFGIKNSQGSAYFDCLQLEKGDTANSYNMLQCSDFKESNSNIWCPTGLESYDLVTENGMRIKGNTKMAKNICQKIVVTERILLSMLLLEVKLRVYLKKGLKAGIRKRPDF